MLHRANARQALFEDQWTMRRVSGCRDGCVKLEKRIARYVLRRKTGPVFGDTELTRYVGHEVECDGFMVGTTLLAERIEVVAS